MLKKIFSYGAFEAISKGLNRGLLLFLPVFLDTTQFGKVGLLISIELLLPVFSVIGFDRVILRFYHERHKYVFFLGTIFRGLYFSHSFLLLVLFLLFSSFETEFFGLSVFPDLFLVLFLVFIQSLNLIFINIRRAQENHIGYFKIKLLNSILKVILVIACLFVLSDYRSYIYGSIIATSLVFFYILYFNDNYIRYSSFSISTFKRITLFSWPFIFHGLSLNLLGHADKFVIQKILNIEQVGVYTLAYSIGVSVTFAFQGISTFMEPLIYKQEKRKSREKLLSTFFLLCMTFGIVFGGILIMASDWLINKLYGGDYSDSLELVPYIIICFIVTPYYLKSNYDLIYKKKTLQIALISVSCALINITVNIFLIPYYGLKGAIVATFIAYFIQNLSFIIFSKKTVFDKEILEVLVLGILLFFAILLSIHYLYILFGVLVFIGIKYLEHKRNFDKVEL